MSIGSLSAQVLLENPSRVYYGPSDPVKGTIELVYRPSAKSPSNELFGRLVLDITFHGRTKTKIYRSNGQSTITYRGRVPLFSLNRTIYNDVVKMSPGEHQSVPFEISFPPSIQSSAYGQGVWKDSPRFEHLREGMALPPSMHRKLQVLGSFSAFVEYRIGCTMKMEGLQVDLCPPSENDEAFVHYDSAYSPAPAPRKQLSGLVKVSNKQLMEEEARPSGLKAKMKATFSSDFYPTYEFDWKVQVPLEIYIGSPTTIVVRIDPRDPTVKRQDLVVPPVNFTQCSLEIKSVTYARTERKSLMPEQREHGSTTETTLHGRVDSEGPFLGDNDWTKSITFEPVLMPSSFRFVNIRIDYTAKLKATFEVAGKTETLSQTWTISLYPPSEDAPPPIDGPSASYRVAGPSNGVGSSKQALAGVHVQPDLPREEQAPPMYNEAVDDPPPLPTEKAAAGGGKR